MDKNGKRGDEAGFDKNNVDVYGLGLAGGGAGTGQTEWSYCHRHHRLDPHGQEPVGHQVQLRRPQVPGDHRLVAGPGRQGLHAQAGDDRRREHD